MTVLNRNKNSIPSGSIYIGRGSKWGNPYIIGTDGNRDTVCRKYEIRLKNLIVNGDVPLNELASLHNQKLVCFCAPLRCHGDTLERYAKWAVRELDLMESV